MTELCFGDAVRLRRLADVLDQLNPEFETEFGEGYGIVSARRQDERPDDEETPF